MRQLNLAGASSPVKCGLKIETIMRTELPENLIEVSYHSEGKPKSVFVSRERLAVREISGGCVALFQADGSPLKCQWPGEFEWRHASLNVANIVCRGNPRLQADWRNVTQAARDQFEREFYGATYKEMASL